MRKGFLGIVIITATLIIFLLLTGCVSKEQVELKELKDLKKECELVKKEIDALGVEVLPKTLEKKMNQCMTQSWWPEKKKPHQWGVTD